MGTVLGSLRLEFFEVPADSAMLWVHSKSVEMVSIFFDSLECYRSRELKAPTASINPPHGTELMRSQPNSFDVQYESWKMFCKFEMDPTEVKRLNHVL